ncbi:MAG: hypothetical protein SWO11_22205 [Thermodesulfobacteriota bacterium]|nr:hypothetical protein [Thermodesulfobacteriota bacterium]
MNQSVNVKEFARIMVNRLDEVKRLVFSQKNDIDSDFPSWKSKREENQGDYLAHDSRRELFVSIVTIIENAQLSYMLLGDHLTDNNWWNQRLEEVSESKKSSVQKEYAIMIKWFVLHSLFSVVEETLRSIQRSSPDVFVVNGRFKSIAKITESILSNSAKTEYQELFKLVRLTRNTIHTNGVFLPENGDNVTINYQEIDFVFNVGGALEWLDDQTAVWFIDAISTAMNSIIRSNVISEIDYCPRTMM